MQNCQELKYPPGKLKILWITDGSNDNSEEFLTKYPDVKILHQPERKGKTNALNRAMKQVESPFVVFCDANTLLAPESIIELIKPFADSKVGCVAGEKRIGTKDADIAAGAGEGTYWRYESVIKRLESELHSTMGAAGELYAIRTELFHEIGSQYIIDDFVNSLQIAMSGFSIKYAWRAFATESSSADVKEELKRKIRIASGGIQTVFSFPKLLNIFKYRLLSFQYISHKVLRWTLVPWSFFLAPGINLLICLNQDWSKPVYVFTLALSVLFYLLVILGALFEKRSLRKKFLFLPYYLTVMNYAQIAGLIRYLKGSHSVVWERAQRA